MTTSWDMVCKVFAHGYPYALFSLFNIAGTFVQAHTTELKDINRNVDNLLEVVSHGQHIEFQSSKDATMAERLLKYNVLIRRQQNLPVLSCVLYLLPDGKVPALPLRWNAPGEPEVLTF
jgi:hypothetical protein